MMNNKSDSNDAIVYFRKGNSCLKSKKLEEAIENYSKAVNLDPKFSDAHFYRGMTYANMEKYEEAIKDFDKAVNLNPGDPKIHFNRGNAYAMLEKYEEAIDDYDKTIALDPTLSGAYYNRGNAYYNLEKHKEAIKDFNKAISLNSKLSEAYINRGIILFNQNKYKEAIKDFDKAVKLDQKNPDTFLYRGNAYNNLKNYKEAIKDFDKAISLNSKLSEAYTSRGNTLFNQNKYKEAIKDFDKAVKLDQKNPDTFLYRGNAYNNLKNYKEAIKDFDKAISLNSKLSEAYTGRGITLFNQNKYKEAIKDFDQAVKFDQKNPDTFLYRGNAYNNLNNYEEAIKDFDKAVKFDHKNPYIYINRGFAYNNLNNYEEAIKNFDKAISFNSKLSEAYTGRGNTYFNQRKYKEAIKDLDQAVKFNHKDPYTYINRGFAYNNLNNYEEAIKNFDKAVKCGLKRPEIDFNRGNAFFNQEKYDKAIDNYITIINNSKDNKNYNKYKNISIYYIGIAFFQKKQYKECNNYLSRYLKLEKKISLNNTKFIYQIIGENYICLKNYKKGIEYLSKSQNDPIEILSIYKNIKEMNTVTSSLIDKNPNCRFNKIVASIKDEELIKIYKNIYLSILKIIYSLLIKNSEKYSFAHYTTRKIASQLIFDKSPLRLSSAITTNDPTEGETLLKYLNIKTHKVNSSNKLKNMLDLQAFISCFSFNEESLNQFRLYGKENSEEATGISIILNHNFFNQDMSLDILPEEQKRNTKEYNGIMIDHKYPLFRCLYIDPDKNKVVSIGHSDADKINNKLKNNINKFLSNIKTMLSKLENKNKDIIENLFLTLRYLVKHAAFKEEEECRMICIKNIKKDAKKEKDEREIYFTEDYSKMYTKYQIMDKSCLKKVIFGPKANGIDIFQKALEHKQIYCKCEKSKLPFV